jgi:hypothetical protein
LGKTPITVQWTVPSNYSSVRQTLQSLMGPRFAESDGYPLPWELPSWVWPTTLVLLGVIVLFSLLAVQRRRFRIRERTLEEQLEMNRKELLEVRAEKQRIDAILSIAGCGIDIVDDNDEIVYADAGIERRYGEWRGKKCYEVYCLAENPCAGCCRPGPLDEQKVSVTEFACHVHDIQDPHARVHYSEEEAMRMLGVPFYDESGRWLYARIHFPISVLPDKTETESVVAGTA